MDTLGLANLALDLASIINFIALLLMLRAVVKNRKVLRGYSIAGSFLTFVSIVGFEIAYYLLGNIVGFAFGWATVVFWFVAFVYSLRQRLKGTPKQKEMVEP
jgi:apolipoprotein N-acyltransferase